MATDLEFADQAVNPARRRKLVTRVTWAGLITDLALSAAKLVVGWWSNSQALVADGFHSLSDLGTDILVLWISRHSSREPDLDHPYGHARFETAGTVALGSILFLVAIGILIDAGSRIMSAGEQPVPGTLAVVVAVISIGAKEALYWLTVITARRVDSELLRANAWHHRSDGLSSVVVLIALTGASLGITWLDSLGAAVVALMVAWVGAKLFWKSTMELVDTGLAPEVIEGITETILQVDGVEALHLLRTRSMGGKALVDVHLQLEDGTISVSEGHQVSEYVRHRVIKHFPGIDDVLVHIDPEDDEQHAPSRNLPLRNPALQRIRALLEEELDIARIVDVRLHYLRGRFRVDLVLPLGLASDNSSLEKHESAWETALLRDADIADVRFYYTRRTE